MAYKEMDRISTGAFFNEGWYHQDIVVSSGTYSPVYKMPEKIIYAIGLYAVGSGSWECSLSPPTALNDGSAIYSRWDGASAINPAITGARMVRDSGTISGMITVKTYCP